MQRKTRDLAVVLGALAVMSLLLGGLRWRTVHAAYGQFNLGVCFADGQGFLASTVDVQSSGLRVLSTIAGPHEQPKLNADPLLLKYAGMQDGQRAYTVMVNGHEDEIYLRVQAGVLTGSFNVKHQLTGYLHGRKGGMPTLQADGQRESRACLERLPDVLPGGANRGVN